MKKNIQKKNILFMTPSLECGGVSSLNLGINIKKYDRKIKSSFCVHCRIQ